MLIYLRCFPRLSERPEKLQYTGKLFAIFPNFDMRKAFCIKWILKIQKPKNRIQNKSSKRCFHSTNDIKRSYTWMIFQILASNYMDLLRFPLVFSGSCLGLFWYLALVNLAKNAVWQVISVKHPRPKLGKELIMIKKCTH